MEIKGNLPQAPQLLDVYFLEAQLIIYYCDPLLQLTCKYLIK